jgi:hypothetical protein
VTDFDRATYQFLAQVPLPNKGPVRMHYVPMLKGRYQRLFLHPTTHSTNPEKDLALREYIQQIQLNKITQEKHTETFKNAKNQLQKKPGAVVVVESDFSLK